MRLVLILILAIFQIAIYNRMKVKVIEPNSTLDVPVKYTELEVVR